MATVSAHLPPGSQLESDFFSYVKANYGGKPGPYLKKLIERDLAGITEIPAATSSDALIQLAKAFQPALVPIFAEWAKKHTKVSQGEVIANLLYALAFNVRRFPDDDLFTIEIKPQRELTIDEIGDLPHGLVSDEEMDRYYAANPAMAAQLIAAVERLKKREQSNETDPKEPSIKLGTTQAAFDSTLAAPRQHEEELPAPTGVVETLRAQAGKSTVMSSKQPATPDPSAPTRKGASPGKQAP